MNRPLVGGPSGAALARIVGALGTRPDLWWVALVTVFRLAATGWWRRRPHVPRPAGGLWAFRMETAYGRADADPEVEDVVAFLEWCRDGGRRYGRAGAGEGDGVAGGRLRPTGPS